MKAIIKRGDGGHHLNQANTQPPQSRAQATSRWSSFAHKETLLGYLLDEQYQLCCYSELRADLDGLGYHIEHVENKSQNPPRTFDYRNLAASALNSAADLSAFKALGHEVFGGHAPNKQEACDISRFISCHQQDCRRFFSYLSDGRIVPSPLLDALERDCALYTIDTLNLNSPYLLTRRRNWWDELDTLFQEHSTKEWSVTHWSIVELIPINNRLNQFFSLTRQFFGPTAEITLRQHAPLLL